MVEVKVFREDSDDLQSEDPTSAVFDTTARPFCRRNVRAK